MTDHLEHYRRMARSIRFFPPVSLTPLSQKSVQEPLTLTPVVTSSLKHTITEADVSPEVGPPIDPSEHVAALVHEAVCKPTVLPATYTIQENIGDRISRLATPKPVKSVIIQPKIPQPASNSTSAHVSPALESAIDPEHVAALVHEAVCKPTVLPTTYTILEDIGDRISRLTNPKPVDVDIIPPEIVQPDSEGTSAETIEPQPSEADTKKSLDDTHLEASAPATVGASATTVEEMHSDESVTVVVEPVPVEETTDNEASTEVVAEPVAVEETPSDDAVGVVAEPVEVEQTLDEQVVTATVAELPQAEETLEDQTATAVVAQPVEVEQTLDEQVVTATVAELPQAEETLEDQTATEVVAQPVEVEQTLDEQTATEVVAQPVEVEQTPDEAEETPEDQATSAVVAEPVEVEQTSDDISDNNISADVAPEPVAITETISENISNTDTSVAEAEDTQAPTLLERVSSVIEAVSTAFKPPEVNQEESETVVEPSVSDSAATETPVADTAEPLTSEAPAEESENTQAPTLLERVSSVIEAVSTAFKQPEADQEESETVVEPSVSDSAATEAPAADRVEPLTSEELAEGVENTQAPTLLEGVSSVEAVVTPLKDSEADHNNSEAVVEPAAVAAENLSDNTTLEITCPKCESTDIRKNGRRHDKQRYVCKDCGREFVMPSSAKAEDKPKNQASSPVEASKVKGTESATVSGDNTSESSKPQSKKKTKGKGFGGSKKAK